MPVELPRTFRRVVVQCNRPKRSDAVIHLESQSDNKGNIHQEKSGL